MLESKNINQKPTILFWLGLAVFLLSPALWGNLTPNKYEGGRSRDIEARVIRNTSSIATMLGEFRTGISDVMLMKTERYLHSGMGYAVHVDRDRLDTKSSMEALDAHQREVADEQRYDAGEDVHKEEAPTLIPPPDKDYRGIIGTLQREVKPWKNPSEHAKHTDGLQVLPWFRVATLSDPHHIRSYSIGGYFLSTHSNREEAEKFLKEGINNNPNAFQLYLSLGEVYMQLARSKTGDIFNPNSEARNLLNKAREAYITGGNLVIKQWPRDSKDGDPRWSKYDLFDARTSMRMAVLTEQHYGSEDKAVDLARQYLKVAPDDKVIQRILKKIQKKTRNDK